ncbi:MAG: nascent polypeptide-associated complex protein [Candidatus Pacearchaeota archaeon]
MFGNFSGFNAKKMQNLMKQLGMNQEELSGIRVIIEKKDGKRILIENPSIIKMSIQGHESFQIWGDIVEEGFGEESEESDIKFVMEKTGATEEQVKKALKKSNNDIAEAIIILSKNRNNEK